MTPTRTCYHSLSSTEVDFKKVTSYPKIESQELDPRYYVDIINDYKEPKFPADSERIQNSKTQGVRNGFFGTLVFTKPVKYFYIPMPFHLSELYQYQHIWKLKGTDHWYRMSTSHFLKSPFSRNVLHQILFGQPDIEDFTKVYAYEKLVVELYNTKNPSHIISSSSNQDDLIQSLIIILSLFSVPTKQLIKQNPTAIDLELIYQNKRLSQPFKDSIKFFIESTSLIID